MAPREQYAVAASRQWTDQEDGLRRLPAGEVHAWEPGLNQTGCGACARAARPWPGAAATPHGRGGTAPVPGRERRLSNETSGY